MKISGSSKIESKSLKKAKKTSSGSGADFARALGSSGGEVEATAATSTGGPVTSVDSLLSLQEVPDASSGRSKGLDQAMARASDMLDMLEEIRRGILLGSIPAANLRGLADMARGRKENLNDPNLSEILEEIELRAEVELAKLGL